jgi:Cdc6-like AAA superfamily ATPase
MRRLQPMTTMEKVKMKAKIARVFTPSAPIDNASLFAGRKLQLTKLINAASQRGQHAALFGERGVGKTSLANVLSDFLKPFGTFLITSTNCEANTNFKTIWTNVFNELTVIKSEVGMGFSPPTHTERSSLSKQLSDDPSPEEIRHLLKQLGKSSIVIIDELDQIKDDETTSRLANTIKTLSDHSTDATLILVGVSDSLDNLIAEHRSIERALVQIPMPRMSPDELMEIIKKGFPELQMTIDPIAARRISNLSHGLPHYTHSLALYAAQAAVDRDSMAVNQDDVVEAIKSAIDNAQQSIRKSYHDATSSPRGNLYSEVLLSCALAETDELGYFPAANVRKPMSEIKRRPYDIPAFSQHLNDFCESTRGAVLQKTGYPRRYRFRFVNPLMEPFVVMKGISSGLINADTLDSDSAGKPIIPAASIETLPLFSQDESSLEK